MRVVFKSASTGRMIAEKTFESGPNLGYTFVYGGPAQGPEGMAYGNSSPFILVDDITPVTTPTRWKGHWYRMSETNVNIDFAIQDPRQGIAAKLFDKPNRSVYQLSDFPAGTYTFNPLLKGSDAPLRNDALSPPALVELTNVMIQNGDNFDVIALGNFLGKAPNSLRLVGQRYRPVIARGCIEIAPIENVYQSEVQSDRL